MIKLKHHHHFAIFLALVTILSALLVGNRVVSAPSSSQGLQISSTSVLAPSGDNVPRFCNPPNVASVVTNVASGPWSDTSTWDSGQVPGSNESVQVAPGTTVTYDANSSTPLNCIEVQGTLNFVTNSSTKLVLNELMVMPTGALIVGTQSNPVPSNITAEIVIRNSSLKTGTIDPKQYGQGVIIFGDATMHGATKSPTFVRLASEPTQGQSTLNLESSVSGWKPGDRLFLPDTRLVSSGALQNNTNNTNGYNPETATIASVSGNSITLTSPLLRNHLGALDADGTTIRFLPYVGNLTRNIIIRSENPSGTRGHGIALHRAKVDIRYVSFEGMGRTTAFPLDNTTFDSSGTVTHIGTNQIGRYPLHMHHVWGPLNPQNSGYQYQLIGNAISDGKKWAITVHNSHYGLIQDNVVFDAQGAGIATEDGNESYNDFIHNYSAHATGENGAVIPNGAFGGEGDEGSNWWLNGSGGRNKFRDNVAANARQHGFILYGRGKLLSGRLPLFRGADLNTSGEYETVANLGAQIISEFRNNEAYSTFLGFTLYNTDGANYTVNDLKGWNAARAEMAMYYGLRQPRILGFVGRGHRTFTNSPSSALGGDVYTSFTVDGFDIQGYNKVAIWLESMQNITLQNGLFVNKGDSVRWGNQEPTAKPPAGTTHNIRNVRFLAPAGFPVKGIGTTTVLDGTKGVNDITRNIKLFVTDYNQVPGDNFQIFFPAQAPTFIMPVSNADNSFIGCPTAGLTNALCWAQHGKAISGEIAICADTTTHHEINGFSCGASTPSPTNQAPTVNAGADIAVVLPASASLNGTVSDDGLPNPPATVTTTWSKVSGTGTVTFASASAVDTTATFSVVGTYVLQLTASDGALSASDTVQVIVTAVTSSNQAPIVNAGADITVVLPASASLNGTVSDDGLPNPPGGVTMTWSKVSGPGTVTFGNASAVDTTGVFSLAGTYVLQLTANDGSLSSNDTVQVTVSTVALVNKAPVVSAGADKTINILTFSTLDGTMTDDGLPSPATVTTTWSKVSGPGTVTFASASAVDTTATFSVVGTYVLQLTANDSLLSANDTVQVTVTATTPITTNQAPSVSAGTDQTVTLPASLNGTVSDDGLPNPPGSLTVTWSKVSGPGTVTFASNSAVDTTATFSVVGTYVLQLTASDGALSANDAVQITVIPASVIVPVNQSPNVFAGVDQTVNILGFFTLDGTVYDDGLPSSATVTTTWSKVSGPGTVTFGNANTVDTTATFSLAGTYVLQLTANDGVLSANDAMQVIVNPVTQVNQPPSVFTGTDITVVFPNIVNLNGTVTDDGLPNGNFTTTWSKDSGSGTVTFGNKNQVDTTATFSEPGLYILQLTANDGILSSSDTIRVTVNTSTVVNKSPILDNGVNIIIPTPKTSTTNKDNAKNIPDISAPKNLCLKINLEKQETHKISSVAISIKDQTTDKIIFTGITASDEQGNILLDDPVILSATPGSNYTISVKPATFFKRVVKNIDIAYAIGGDCIILPFSPFGDINADGHMGLIDFRDAIWYYLGITANPTLDEISGPDYFSISDIFSMFKKFVTWRPVDDVE